MLKIVIMNIGLTLANIDVDINGYSQQDQPLAKKAFSQHVRNFCLNQIIDADLDIGLEVKYMNAYVIDCAADYGVFGIELN